MDFLIKLPEPTVESSQQVHGTSFGIKCKFSIKMQISTRLAAQKDQTDRRSKWIEVAHCDPLRANSGIVVDQSRQIG